MTNLDSWNEEFGDIDIFARKKKEGFDWDVGTAYPVRIASGDITTSQRGDVQLKLQCIIMAGEDDEAKELGRSTEYFILPKQASDLNLKDYDLVSKLTKRRTADMIRILSAANRHKFGLYSEIKIENGKKVFYDFEDQAMTNEKFKQREAEIHELITAWIDTAHRNVGSNIEELSETRLYIRKVENKKTPKYPYTNIYAIRPRDGKIYTDEATPF